MSVEVTAHTTGRIAGPGFYAMPTALYHADPAPEPSLSSSVARTLLDDTPRHAAHAHPRLLGSGADAKSRKLDLGSIAHELLIGEGRGIHVISATNKAGEVAADYKTKAAQEERDEALAAGLTPILPCDLSRAERMVSAVRQHLDGTPGAEGAFREGRGETAALWFDPFGLWGRALLDWWGPSDSDLFDLKTTSGGLSDRAIAARIAEGLDIQEAWYRRGVAHLRPDLAGRLRFRFVFVETDEPHECRVVELSGEQQWLGERKAAAAAAIFHRCLATETWPGYPPGIARVEAPSWAAAQWQERELTDPLIREVGAKLLLARSPYAPMEIAS